MARGCRRFLLLGGLALLAGCQRAPQEQGLLPFEDQYASTKPRWLDVGGVAYRPEFVQRYAARDARVNLSYNAHPHRPYFSCTLWAHGLKPNFCYQLKLLGRPSGLWPDGDDAFNEWLGRHGRWWDYARETWVDNQTHNLEYDKLSSEARRYVVGYVYFGPIVTDEQGDIAPTVVTADRCWHITGLAGQDFLHEAPGTRTAVSFERPLSAYPPGSTAGRAELFLEPEADNPSRLAPLPAGTHSVVLMLTEESFHQHGAQSGHWRSVFVSDWPTTNSPKTGQPWVTGRGQPLTITIPAHETTLEAAIVNPREGEQLAGELMVQVVADGASAAEWQVDDGAWEPLTFNAETGYWEAFWSTDGKAGHRLTARARDAAKRESVGLPVSLRPVP